MHTCNAGVHGGMWGTSGTGNMCTHTSTHVTAPLAFNNTKTLIASKCEILATSKFGKTVIWVRGVCGIHGGTWDTGNSGEF